MTTDWLEPPPLRKMNYTWHLKVVGKRAAVKSIILADPNIPQQLKDVIALLIEAGTPKPGEVLDKSYQDGIRVETHGHYSPADAWSSISQLEIDPIKLSI